MLARFASSFSNLVQRYLPSSFSFAVILTVIVLILGVLVERESPLEMMNHWSDGFWSFLEFGMQMTLIILTGYAVAVSGPVDRLLGRATKRIKTGRQAVVWTMGISAVGGYLSWGLGFVLGPIFLKRLQAEREIQQPFLVAAGYASALAVIPAGLTVTVPLLVNTPGHFMEEEIGLIPLTETIFAPTLMISAAALLISMFLVFLSMQPQDQRGPLNNAGAEPSSPVTESSQPAQAKVSLETRITKLSPAERVDTNRTLAWIIAGLGLIVVGIWFATEGLNLDINIVNFAFLFIGIALHSNLSRYFAAFTDGARSASAVILQFPFYAGIMGMVVASGLAVTIAELMTAVSTPETAGLLSFHATGVLNMMVPSAGGGWGVQADVLIELANQQGVPYADMVAAYTLGDMATNLLNPFFALAALGISGVRLGDVWGYALIAMVVYLIVGSAGIFFLPMIF